MIDYEIKPGAYRGTIEVFSGFSRHPRPYETAQWFWRAKGKNGQIIADGSEGYKRRQGCVNAVDRLLSSRLTGITAGAGADPRVSVVVPWRLVVLNRDGSVNREGALY